MKNNQNSREMNQLKETAVAGKNSSTIVSSRLLTNGAEEKKNNEQTIRPIKQALIRPYSAKRASSASKPRGMKKKDEKKLISDDKVMQKPKLNPTGEEEGKDEEDFPDLSNEIVDNFDQQYDPLLFEEGIDEIEDEENEEQSEQGNNRSVTMLRSVYRDRPATVFFPYPQCCAQERLSGGRTYIATQEETLKWNLTFRMNDCNRPYKCVTKSFESAGFKETHSSSSWNGYWASNRISFIRKLNSEQRVNHYSGCWNLGRKDMLWMQLSKQRRRFPIEYSFLPKTYLLNNEYDRFIQSLSSNPKSLWIVKPVASCCGKGIRVISKTCKMAPRFRKHYLASEYIHRPHLINGFKYDLRIYVLVSSYDPLRVYIFEEGLVRFATEKYDVSSQGHQSHRLMHLTNYSVNKNGANFVKNKAAEDGASGSKWALSAWKKEMALKLGDQTARKVLEEIDQVVVKTCIAVEPYMLEGKSYKHRKNCFELYGFDILLDSNLKPWLLEVNVCPSLSSSSPLDRQIKTTLISDILNLIGFKPYNKIKKTKKAKSNQQRRYSLVSSKRASTAKIYQKIDTNSSNNDSKLSESTTISKTPNVLTKKISILKANNNSLNKQQSNEIINTKDKILGSHHPMSLSNISLGSEEQFSQNLSKINGSLYNIGCSQVSINNIKQLEVDVFCKLDLNSTSTTMTSQDKKLSSVGLKNWKRPMTASSCKFSSSSSSSFGKRNYTQRQSASNTNQAKNINLTEQSSETDNILLKKTKKNVRELADLNESNCLEKLSQEDWEVLFECDEEYYRKGNFRRIFPPDDITNIDNFSQLFLFPRFHNLMFWQLLKSPSNFLEVISPKIFYSGC